MVLSRSARALFLGRGRGALVGGGGIGLCARADLGGAAGIVAAAGVGLVAARGALSAKP